MESIDYDRLMQANAARVFSERDPPLRLRAIRELYTPDAVLTEPEGVFKEAAAISDAVTRLLSKLPSTFSFKPIGTAIGHHAHFKDDRIERLFVFLDTASV
jgi:hypothetical protein